AIEQPVSPKAAATSNGNEGFINPPVCKEGTQCVESYDFVCQYKLKSGARVCRCSLSSCVWATPLSITPTYPIWHVKQAVLAQCDIILLPASVAQRLGLQGYRLYPRWRRSERQYPRP